MIKNKFIMGLLITTLFISGCGNQINSKQDVAMGRYVEQDIELPSKNPYSSYISQKEDGTIVVIDSEAYDELKIFELDDKGQWSKSEVKAMKWPKDINCCLDLQLQDNGVMILYGTNENELMVCNETWDGSMQNVALKEKGKGVQVPRSSGYCFKKAESGDYFYQGEWGNGVSCYDGTSGELKYVHKNEVFGYTINKDELYEVGSYKQPGINICEVKTGNLKTTIDATSGSGNIIISGQQKGELYLVNSNGISHLAPKGTLWEQIVERNATTFTSADLAPVQAFAQGESYLVRFMGSNSTAIKRYYYDANIPARPSKEVKVFMIYDNDIIEHAIGLYQKKHPDVYVNVQIPSNDTTYDDAIKGINTDLLAGNGPDIIMLDELPINTYIDKGVLADITDVIKPHVEKGEWLEQIASVHQVNDKYYAVPTRFRMPMIWGDSKVVAGSTSLEDYAKYKKDHPEEIIFGRSALELFDQLGINLVPTWVNEKGELDKEKLKASLEALKTLEEKKSILNDEKGCYRADFEQNKSNELIDTAYKATEAFILEPRSPYEGMFAASVLNQRGDGQVSCIEVNGKGIFKEYGTLGINASSKNQEIAKEIIELILGDEIQSIGNYTGLPISKKAMANLKEDMIGFTDVINDDQGRKVVLDKSQEAYYKRFEDCYSKAGVTSNSCNSMYIGLIGEIEDYLMGKLTLDEVLEQADKVNTLQLSK